MAKVIDQDQEEVDALRGVLKAMRERDKEAEARLWPKVKLLPHNLKAMKKIFGADYIRKQGFNTELADEEFGLGWLDH